MCVVLCRTTLSVNRGYYYSSGYWLGVSGVVHSKFDPRTSLARGGPNFSALGMSVHCVVRTCPETLSQLIDYCPGTVDTGFEPCV